MKNSEFSSRQPAQKGTMNTPLILAFVIALTATLGALFIGEVLGQMPCVLCWYQRIAMFPLALVLGIAAFRNEVNAVYYALPLSIAGAAIAAWHSGLYLGFIPEPIVPCSQNGPSCTSANMMFLGLPIPIMALTAFILIILLLVLTKRGKT